MRLAPEWTARLVVPGDDVTVPRSELLRDGSPTGVTVEGAVLEAAVDAGEGRVLVFLTHDVPFEEALSIHLLDAQGHVVDTAWLGGAMVTGRFDSLEIVAPRRVAFRFLGNGAWRLTLLDAPAWRLPRWPEAIGVHRSWAWRRAFRLERTASRTSARN